MIHVHTAAEFAQSAADLVAAQLKSKPRSVLALPTGSTPLALYAELVRRSRGGFANLAEARIFDLDEYRGLPSSDPSSYAAFIRAHLTAPLGLADDHVRLLRGDAPDPQAECDDYERAIAQLGGIDLCVLGLGENGHIAFNEPGSAWDTRTRVVELAASTRARIEAGSDGAPAGSDARAHARDSKRARSAPGAAADRGTEQARREGGARAGGSGSGVAGDQSPATSQRDPH